MKKVIIFLVIFLIVPVLFVEAQDGTSAPTDTQAEVAPAEVATSTPRSTESLVATSTRPITTPTPVPTPTPKPTTVVKPTPIAEIAPQNTPENSELPLIPIVLGALTIAAGIAAYALNTKNKNPNKQDDKKDQSRCFDIKKLMDQKLEEITDLRGQLESRLKDTGQEKVRGALAGTPEGRLLALIEAGEKEYNRLKGLFDQCMIEFGNKKMARVSTYLNFSRNTEEAFSFYKSTFGGEFEGSVSRFKDMPQKEGQPPITEEDKNLIMHIALPILGGHILMATDAPESMGFKITHGDNMYINLEPDNRGETDRLFKALGEGGVIEMPLQEMFWGDYFGSLTDKFGVNWMFNCKSKD